MCPFGHDNLVNITIVSDGSDIIISEKPWGRCERARLMIEQIIEMKNIADS